MDAKTIKVTPQNGHARGKGRAGLPDNLLEAKPSALSPMPFSRLSRFLPSLVLLALGLAAGTWLNAFFHDKDRPADVQQRADRLVSSNYRAGEFTAPLPPSPAHWAQRLTGVDPSGERRYGVARESAALWIALCCGNLDVAGVLAFALAFVCATALARRLSPNSPTTATGLAILTLLGVAHGQTWQLHDPFPWLVLIGACLFFPDWHRGKTVGPVAWRLVAGMSLLLLCSPVLALAAGLAWVLARLAQRPARNGFRLALIADKVAWRPLVLCAVLLATFFAARNLNTTGSVWQSPAGAYRELNVTAPVWFWQTIKEPKPGVDFVVERYDELVAITKTRIPTPAYAWWLKRIWKGLETSGGVVLALVGFAAALTVRSPGGGAFFAVAGVLAALALLRYDMPSAWWLLLVPCSLERVLAGLRHIVETTPGAPLGRLKTAFALVFVVALNVASPDSANVHEAAFREKRDEIVKKILEQEGRHLVFVTLDPSVEAVVEPADLPRYWENSRILYARDLGTDSNTALVGRLGNHIPWRMVVLRDRVGLRAGGSPEGGTEANTARPENTGAVASPSP